MKVVKRYGHDVVYEDKDGNQFVKYKPLTKLDNFLIKLKLKDKEK